MVTKYAPKRLEFHGLMQRTMDADPERVRKLHELAERSTAHVAEYNEPTALIGPHDLEEPPHPIERPVDLYQREIGGGVAIVVFKLLRLSGRDTLKPRRIGFPKQEPTQSRVFSQDHNLFLGHGGRLMALDTRHDLWPASIRASAPPAPFCCFAVYLTRWL